MKAQTRKSMSTRVFIAGRIEPRRDPRPCSSGNHAGPLLNTARYNAIPGWEGFGECACCFSTVHRSSVRRPAA